jgi:hypothetical protein
MPDAAAIAAEQLDLSAEQRKIVEEAREGEALAACFGGGTDLLAQTIRATVTVAKNSLTVTGHGFRAAAAEGSILRVGATLRAVVKVENDTSLEVDQSWPEDRTAVEGWFYPPGTLSQGSVVGARIGLDDAAIAGLLVDALNQDELAAGLAAKLYINAGSALPRAQLIVDRTDVSYTLQVLDQLDAARVDRLNRIVRLSQASGIAASDLDWILHASGHADFAGGGLTAVGETIAMAQRLSLPPDEATALWSVLKTWGRGSDPRPADLFDRVFNATSDRAGTYRPLYPDNPLFTNDVRTWTFANADRDTPIDRTWLSAALAVTDKDLMRIAAVVANGAESKARRPHPLDAVVGRPACPGLVDERRRSRRRAAARRTEPVYQPGRGHGGDRSQGVHRRTRTRACRPRVHRVGRAGRPARCGARPRRGAVPSGITRRRGGLAGDAGNLIRR